MRNRTAIYILAALLPLLFSCGTAKKLDDGETLYVGADIEISGKTKDRKSLEKRLEQLTVPDRNKRLFGLVPFKLWVYNLAGDSVPKKGFRNWLKTKIGEPPVVYAPYMAERTLTNLGRGLKNDGYFDGVTGFSKQVKNNKTKLVYTVDPKSRYVIRSVSFPDSTDILTGFINKSRDRSLLVPGEFYSLVNLKKERERIAQRLTGNGFYAFVPDYLEFRLDSSRVNSSIDIALKLKQITPLKARSRYIVDSVIVSENLSGSAQKTDTTVLNKMAFITHSGQIAPDVIERNILFEPGGYYKKQHHEGTLNKLIGLNMFRFVSIEYKERGDSGKPILTPHIALTPGVPKSLDIKIEAVTKSNNLSGPGLVLSYSDNNFRNRAQTFTTALNAGFETQLNSSAGNFSSYNLKFGSTLQIPHLVVPFIDVKKYLAKRYSARTQIKLDNSLVRWGDYFNMYSLDATFGYNWQETVRKNHDLKLLTVNYSNLFDKSETFKRFLNLNPLAGQGYSEQFIISLQYSFTYNGQLNSNKRVQPYFEGHVEFAGNSLALVNSLGSNGGSNVVNNIFGVPYAQFSRVFADVRLLYPLAPKTSFVYRFFGGAGLAYGNSDVLPYSRQFYIGGANSLRGFRYHSIGPGSFADTDETDNIVGHTGDVKLETNLELRFPISGILHGAIFTDAGNIWLLRRNEARPGGEFNVNTFYREIAVSSGFGIRLDASFVVLRLDAGIPIRKPSDGVGLNQIRSIGGPLDFKWYRNNIILNFAIGYPF